MVNLAMPQKDQQPSDQRQLQNSPVKPPPQSSHNLYRNRTVQQFSTLSQSRKRIKPYLAEIQSELRHGTAKAQRNSFYQVDDKVELDDFGSMVCKKPERQKSSYNPQSRLLTEAKTKSTISSQIYQDNIKIQNFSFEQIQAQANQQEIQAPNNQKPKPNKKMVFQKRAHDPTSVSSSLKTLENERQQPAIYTPTFFQEPYLNQ